MPIDLVLGVTGSIAAYKAVTLVRLLTAPPAEDEEPVFDVWPVLTKNATRFVGPMTFTALCGHPAITDMWQNEESARGEINHVEVAHRAQLVLVAPCTADTLARLAIGRADDPLAAIALAATAPKLVAPAMESGMWENAATQQNLATLKARGFGVIPPDSGNLASGRSGVGRMAAPEVICEAALTAVTEQDLAGRHVIITAGPTREPFDPVRFISNRSSGKMGYALARAAKRRGARVTLVSGPVSLTPPDGVDVVPVLTTQDMLEACRAHIQGAAALIMAAAPADYRPKTVSEHKIKKNAGTGLEVQFEPTPDILTTLAAHAQGAVVVGFAAETQALLANAREKLARKHLDLIVANDVSRTDAGFGTDTNAVTLIESGGELITLGLQSKLRVAEVILDRVVRRLGAPRA